MKVFLNKIYTSFKYIKHQIFFTFFGFTSYCYHSPSCSKYAIEKIKKEGLIVGGFKGLKRISSCR